MGQKQEAAESTYILLKAECLIVRKTDSWFYFTAFYL